MKTNGFTPLHSNMFLLFPGERLTFKDINNFTFQYVSIISDEKLSNLTKKEIFTFQYVSIISNTRCNQEV